MSNEVRVTNIDVKEREREFFFTINEKSKYKIPSKMFPLSSKQKNAVFTEDLTVPFENEVFFKLIDELSLEIGRCYTNTEKIRQVAEQLGLNAYYFSGWIFRADDMPKHHAWLMIKHEDGTVSIVDSLKENLFRKSVEFMPENIDEDIRKAYALAVKEATIKYPRNSEQIIIGQVLNGFIYVGSEDSYRNAQKIYQDLVSKFPNHPAYKRDGDNIHGRSKLQEEMARIGIE